MNLHSLEPEVKQFLMSDLINLRSLMKFKMDLLMQKHDFYCQIWMKDALCDCVTKLSPGCVVACQHFNKAVKQEYAKEEKEINNLAKAIMLLELWGYA